MLNALYYHAYYSYLKGDLDSTRMYYEMLRDEYNSHGDRGALDSYQLRDLKAIRTAITSGVVAKNLWVEETAVPSTIETGTSIKQVELVRRLHYEAEDSVRQCLKSDGSLHLYNIEHPCGDYGRVDMVYTDDTTAYPTEIKPSEGRHDILGQIAKYTLYFRLRLHLKHFKRVQPVTICGSYDAHTLTELKRMSVVTLRYSISNDRVHVGVV
jgi:hypothetical protein